MGVYYDDSVCLMAAQDPVQSAMFGACTELLDYSAFETVQTCEDLANALKSSVCPQLRSCAPETIGAPTGSGSGSGDGDMDSTWCAPGCRPNWPGDNFCDSACDVEECGFDLGDCTRPDPGPAKKCKKAKKGYNGARHSRNATSAT